MKGLEVHGQNPRFFFLMYCLTLWSPGACVHLSLKLDRPIQSPLLARQLEKRNTNFIQYGFAVCELPFYEICRTNVTRIKCSELGCCFHKETCYKKAVPQYMKAFGGLIGLIFVVFCLYMLQSFLTGKTSFFTRKKKNKTVIKAESSSSESSESSAESQDDEY